MEGSCEYIEKAIADSRQGVFLQLGGWARLVTIPHLKKSIMLRNIHKVSLGPGLMLRIRTGGKHL